MRTDGLEQRPSGLWVPPTFNVLRFRATEKTVTLPTGERAKITVDDSRTVKQIEHGEHLDAVVRPRTIRIKIPLRSQEDDRGSRR